MTGDRIRVAVVGTGRWAQVAHIPGWQRDPRAEVVALADVDETALAAAASQVRRAPDHHRLPRAARRPGHRRHRRGDRATGRTSRSPGTRCRPASTCCARSRCTTTTARPGRPPSSRPRRGCGPSSGFTFRYAPAILYAKELIDSGFVGEPYIFNGFEQNSQWIDPATPLRQVDPDADPAQIAVSSIEGYGAPIIDIMHWWLGRPLTAVVGAMRNFVPERG